MISAFEIGQTGTLRNGIPFTVIANDLRGSHMRESLVISIPTSTHGSVHLQLTADGRYPPNYMFDVLPTE